MAATNTGAKFKYNLAGRTSGIIRSFIIANSATITIGDMVKLSGGYIALAGANAKILGVVVGIVDKNGINLDNTKESIDGTWTSSSQTYVAASDNQTDQAVRVLVDIDPFSVWSIEPDSTIGELNADYLIYA